MVRVLFLFLTRFHVNVARSNGNPAWRAKNLRMRTMRSHLMYDAKVIYTKFFSSKLRRVLSKNLILDEMCRLYGKFASYFSSYKWPYCASSSGPV